MEINSFIRLLISAASMLKIVHPISNCKFCNELGERHQKVTRLINNISKTLIAFQVH